MHYSIFLTTFVVQFLTSNGVHVGDQSVINNVAGFVIEQLTEKYPHEIDIGNLTSAALFGTARFEALFGTMTDIHKIERSGDVIVKSDDTEMNVTLTFVFKELRVVYTEYTASFAGMSSCGSVVATANENLFSIYAIIAEGTDCFVSLHEFNVIKLGDFDVKLSAAPKGLCPLLSEETGSRLATFAVNLFREKIKTKVEEAIHDALRNNIPHSTFICVKF